MNPSLYDFAEKVASELIRNKNNWIRSCVAEYAPGIVSLVDSGQISAAARFSKLQGFDLLEEPWGKSAFRRNGEILSVWKLSFE